MDGDTFDVVIAGGGVLGCATARALALGNEGLKICLLEKEQETGQHQSGRNSGVIHAGYNQKPGSMKAKFVVEGSRRLRAFCKEHGIMLKEDGILVVARKPEEVETLKILYQRGTDNGAKVELLDSGDIKRIETEAVGAGALHAAEGSSLDAKSYVAALHREAEAHGVTVQTGSRVTNLEETAEGATVHLRDRSLKCRVFVNAAGLHADRLAQALGVGQGFQIMPFRGFYSELIPERRRLVRAHIYPCPDLNFPFLGVHLSRTFDDRILVGPGAALAGGREAYSTFDVNVPDLTKMLAFGGFWRLLTRPEFRGLVRTEWKKSLFASAVAQEAAEMVPAIKTADLMPGQSGIRAQLVSKDGKLVEDLTIESTKNTIHILNAVSPALTCSLPFGDHVANLVCEKL